MTGLLVLACALAGSAVVAGLMHWKNGRFSADKINADTTRAGETSDDRNHLTAAQIGVPLGDRATMVQFSSAFCSPCRATRVLLADVATKVPGVVTVEIDAEAHLQLVRDLGIMRTPTVLVLDAAGIVTTRASGLPRREQVMAALNRTIEPHQ